MASLGFFRKTPSEVTKLAKAALQKDLSDEKNRAELSKRVASMKAIVLGEEGKPPKEEKRRELGMAWKQEDILPQMQSKFGEVDFEVRKDLSTCFDTLARSDIGGFTSQYLPEKASVIAELSRHYTNPELALACGVVLRGALASVPVHRTLLGGPPVDEDTGLSICLSTLIKEVVHNENFEVAADGFATISDLLTKNKTVVHSFITDNFSSFFETYHIMLRSRVYTTRRQGLRLLSELLLDSDHFEIMINYVSNPEYLKIIMTMLRDVRQNIQFEAFHVFKVFVANPNKPNVITQILATNKDKLIKYLREFQNDRSDTEFAEEKALLIETLSNIDASSPSASQSASDSSTKTTATPAQDTSTATTTSASTEK
eukprot:gb/GECG01013560.1/.p1 GENE.gb/GECG01013560.1/~~gb/GECG01013560.1/.p1  ORF type:complete len:372 (+),score=48.65 gb/GECG01013560.1/:1-1116(+)